MSKYLDASSFVDVLISAMQYNMQGKYRLIINIYSDSKENKEVLTDFIANWIDNHRPDYKNMEKKYRSDSVNQFYYNHLIIKIWNGVIGQCNRSHIVIFNNNLPYGDITWIAIPCNNLSDISISEYGFEDCVYEFDKNFIKELKEYKEPDYIVSEELD